MVTSGSDPLAKLRRCAGLEARRKIPGDDLDLPCAFFEKTDMATTLKFDAGRFRRCMRAVGANVGMCPTSFYAKSLI